MFLRISTKKSMKNYSDEIIHLKEKLDKADAVVIGAGAGLSTAAGFTYGFPCFIIQLIKGSQKIIHIRHTIFTE